MFSGTELEGGGWGGFLALFPPPPRQSSKNCIAASFGPGWLVGGREGGGGRGADILRLTAIPAYCDVPFFHGHRQLSFFHAKEGVDVTRVCIFFFGVQQTIHILRFVHFYWDLSLLHYLFIYFFRGGVMGRCGNGTETATEMAKAATPEAGFADGDGAFARFDGPSGLTAAEDGTLFVADTNNHLVGKKRISATIVA